MAGVAPVVHALEGRPNTGMLVMGHRGAPVYAAESTLGSLNGLRTSAPICLRATWSCPRTGGWSQPRLGPQPYHRRGGQVPARATVRNFNGIDYTGFWVDEFTVAELQTLQKWDGQTPDHPRRSDLLRAGPRRESVSGDQGPRTSRPAGWIRWPHW